MRLHGNGTWTAAALGLMALVGSAGAQVPVTLVPDQPAYLTGATVTVRVNMGASMTPVWGGQFFLDFNNSYLGFQSAGTGSSPFVTQVLSSNTSNTVTYAVGSGTGAPNNFGAVNPTTMAKIKFTATNPVASTAGLVSFSSPTSNTKLTDGNATEVTSSTTPLPAISITNWTGTDAWVDDTYATNGRVFGDPVNWPDDGNPGPHAFGIDAFATIQGGVNAVNVAGTVHVAAGNYNEDVLVNKNGVSVLGAGAGSSIVSGPIGGATSTFALAGSGVTLAGFTVTRDGNNPTDWNGALNLAGVSIQGQSFSGIVIRDNLITGNRSAIDINNSNGHVVRNNVITNNHTGLIFRNQTDNETVTENEITNNRTVGVLFLDGSVGTNSPVQTAANSTFSNNNISGNWYGQIVDRQSGGALPTPGTNLKNFSANWLGTTTPVITTANSAEPPYATLIPTVFMGTATPPGGQPDVAGPASANFDITPMLTTGTDTDSGAYADSYGFQGDFSRLTATTQLAQTGSTGRVQEGVNLIANGTLTGGARTLSLQAGTYSDNPVLSKPLTLVGPNAGVAGAGVRGAEAIVVTKATGASTPNTVIGITANDVTIDGITVDGDDTSVVGTPNNAGSDVNAGTGISNRFPALTSVTNVTIQNSIVKNTYIGVRLEGNGSAAAGTVTRNWFDAIGVFDFGYAISMRNHFYADFTSNKVTRTWTGVHTSINSLASPRPTWNISNNEIHTYACGIANLEVDGAGTGATIDSNTITVESAPPMPGAVQPNNVGIWSYVYQGSGTTTITNNTITGHDIGFLVTGAYNTGANQLTINGTNSVVGAKLAGVRFTNHLNVINSPAGFNNPLHENPVGTSQVQNYLASTNAQHLLNVSGLPITGALKDGVVESASGVSSMRLNVTGTHADGSSAVGSSGVKVEGSLASASIVNNPTTFTGFDYGVQVDGGAALIQTTDLTGNATAGIRALNNARVDAGDCSSSNFTGLGSSTGGNTLTGYGFDDAAPWAILDDNTNAQPNVYAQNNDFGATASQNIGLLVRDNADDSTKSYVLYSQAGGQAITAISATPNDYCNFMPGAPTNVILSATYVGLGTIQWYEGTCGAPGASLGSGPSISIAAPLAPGVHSYIAQVNDGCVLECASTTVTVHAAPVITINATLSNVGNAVSRCFDLSFFNTTSCPSVAYPTQQPISFTPDGMGNDVGSVSFTVPCDSYTSVSATDVLHTLRRNVASGDAPHFSYDGMTGNYTLNFTDSKAFRSGNLNNDQYIDILDFGGFISRFGNPDTASTTCSTTGIHADFSGNNVIDAADYTFISTQFLAARDVDCTGALVDAPTTSVGVIDLGRTDWRMAQKADLNRDGVLDVNDINFMGNNGLPVCAADYYGDGTVNVQDIFVYLSNWFAGYPGADFNSDHQIQVDDIFSFLSSWFQGCN